MSKIQLILVALYSDQTRRDVLLLCAARESRDVIVNLFKFFTNRNVSSCCVFFQKFSVLQKDNTGHGPSRVVPLQTRVCQRGNTDHVLRMLSCRKPETALRKR